MTQKQKIERIFFGISIANIFIMFIVILLTKGEVVRVMTYDESNFLDFWNHIRRLLFSANIYATDADAIFPPLAYLFLKLFAYPLSYKVEAGDTIEQIATSGYGILALVMYLMLFGYLLNIAVNLFYKKGTLCQKYVLLGIFITSYTIWGFAFERGNLVIYAMVFLMLGLALRDSTNKVLREIALICTAVSAGFKLYPALFGFLWIVEKRYKEAGRLIIYGLIAFFAPLPFFDSFKHYVYTFSGYLNKKIYSRTSVWGGVFQIFGNNKYTRLLCMGIIIGIIVWALFALFADGVNWKTITLLTATHTIILPEQYAYTYVFIAIPLICFLNETNKLKIDYIYAVLFALVFSIPPLGRLGSGREIYYVWLTLLLIVSVDELVFLIRKWKKV